jgi:sensor domain CHASE-containing protein
VCFEVEGEIKCESEEELRFRELEERLRKHIENKLKELVEQYEIEVTIDVKEGKGVGKWRKKR